jgi:hypothetical protein
MIVGAHQNTPVPSFLPYTTINHNSDSEAEEEVCF